MNMTQTGPVPDAETTTIEISDWAQLPSDPLVSVYMLTYRHEKFISEAIQGVIAQQCNFPIELIIGEDCSPDGTRKIISDYQRRYPKLIRVITSDTNVGARANSTRCRKACRGSYVAICEGDDYWTDPTKLTRQVTLFQANPRLTLVGHAVSVQDASNNAVQVIERSAHCTRCLSTKEVILGDGYFIRTCTLMVKRDVLLHPPPWLVNAPVGDYPLVLYASQLGEIGYIDRVMSTYRTNVSHSWIDRMGKQSSVTEKLALAYQFHEMFNGFNVSSHRRYRKDVRRISSKYVYDAIMRSDAAKFTKFIMLMRHARWLNLFDYTVGFVAILLGLRLTYIRSMPALLIMYLRRLLNDRSHKYSIKVPP